MVLYLSVYFFSVANKLMVINLFVTNVPILYPLKTPDNLWFSGVFMCIEWGHWPEMDQNAKGEKPEVFWWLQEGETLIDSLKFA